ncbi:hypothetical protein LFLT20_02630 [Limosilactobacillus fermentum]|nr:hypothetical protein LFLT20_02630 [Limosilactobacillus fermentum]
MRQLQEQIIEDLKVIPTIDPQVEVRRRIDFLKDYLKQTKMVTLVLGISGGKIPPWRGAWPNWRSKNCARSRGAKTTSSSPFACPMGNKPTNPTP